MSKRASVHMCCECMCVCCVCCRWGCLICVAKTMHKLAEWELNEVRVCLRDVEMGASGLCRHQKLTHTLTQTRVSTVWKKKPPLKLCA